LAKKRRIAALIRSLSLSNIRLTMFAGAALADISPNAAKAKGTADHLQL
jgi:hypothetical protein